MADVPENPDRPCSNCGTRDWDKFLSRTPTDYPDSSDVVKHYFTCTECGAEAFVYEENGSLQFTGNLR